ncbi:hypothetical protein BO78DRAFT_417756 [Aspergillus sclerotiicarbonarius CBS 121057]|uniref:RING-type domain-containing protein n=1 Tax=Aspergillus sclerotiicarbonarius (strain CBS 121057 / IBT 28362) TaxID=1448318 RepID=A0A319FIS3_ASPSB|nr:hypothetical protein BO78DRAFT_417756 [Aspergillus sclerotiicarbonarius CBS 121057]
MEGHTQSTQSDFVIHPVHAPDQDAHVLPNGLPDQQDHLPQEDWDAQYIEDGIPNRQTGGGSQPRRAGDSIDNPIEIDIISILDLYSDTNSPHDPRPADYIDDTTTNYCASIWSSGSEPCSTPLRRSGDGIDTPIHIDDTTSAIDSDGGMDIPHDRRSNDKTDDQVPIIKTINGHITLQRGRCDTCHNIVSYILLGCGHLHCLDCFTRDFHRAVLDEADNNETIAQGMLTARVVKPQCPRCKEHLRGNYVNAGDHDTFAALCVPLQCPASDHRGCFLEGYMLHANMVRLA